MHISQLYHFLHKKLSWILVTVSLILISIFLYVSNKLVAELSEEEHNRVQIWANATSLFSSGEELSSSTVDLIFSVLQGNKTIPVIVLDKNDNILIKSNIPSYKGDSLKVDPKLIQKLKRNKPIEIYIDESEKQYLYYDDSLLLKKLSYYPYVQLLVLAVFLIVLYIALISVKRAEQNQLWVGLSKETAHQLGTPISSLMAWLEVMKMKDADPMLLKEISKDVVRLKIIAERFSKIGSMPELKNEDLNALILDMVNYMSLRSSSKISYEVDVPDEVISAKISYPLFQWVIENLYKNAIDAIEKGGSISTRLFEERDKIVIEVSDTGRGMSKSDFKKIFTAGYTTKKRGWGLGLTLVKRIVEEYHQGKIFVKVSEPGKGTTFRIELPLR